MESHKIVALASLKAAFFSTLVAVYGKSKRYLGPDAEQVQAALMQMLPKRFSDMICYDLWLLMKQQRAIDKLLPKANRL